MSEIRNFNKEFVERTIDILEKCSKNTEYEVTLLLNCLLALVTLPIERNKVSKDKVDTKTLQFRADCINELDRLKNQYQDEIFNKEDKYTFNHIRNSIAHLHIEVENSCYKGIIENIILRDALTDKKFKRKEYNFDISISVNKLREFSLYTANEYLKCFF